MEVSYVCQTLTRVSPDAPWPPPKPAFSCNIGATLAANRSSQTITNTHERTLVRDVISCPFTNNRIGFCSQEKACFNWLLSILLPPRLVSGLANDKCSSMGRYYDTKPPFLRVNSNVSDDHGTSSEKTIMIGGLGKKGQEANCTNPGSRWFIHTFTEMKYGGGRPEIWHPLHPLKDMATFSQLCTLFTICIPPTPRNGACVTQAGPEHMLHAWILSVSMSC